MFGNLFKRRKTVAPANTGDAAEGGEASDDERKTEALLAAIRERAKDDPLIGAKIGAKEVYHRLVEGLRNERGVHIESLLAILGTLAGYACQASLREQATAKGMNATSPFHVVEAKDGSKYYFGDALNAPLVSAHYSVWGLAAGAVQQLGQSEFPDLNALFQHTAATVGTAEFGVPRLPEGHAIGDAPINYLTAIWPKLLPTVRLFCADPAQWPILYGLAIQETINMGKEVISPVLALQLVMECAIPMSKVDLAQAGVR